MGPRASGFADPSTAAVDVEALRAYRLGRVRAALRARGLPAVLLYDPINIRYATDAGNMQLWTMHNFCRYVLLAADGPVVLFEFPGCEFVADGLAGIDEVRPATTWYYWGSGARLDERAGRWAAEIADWLAGIAGREMRLAVDRIEPLGVAALAAHGVDVLDGQAALEHARCIKSAEEIAAMRASLAVCRQGMERMQRALVPGIRENELWAELHHANIAGGGEWIETRLLCSGPRTNPWLQECGPRRIERGELVAFDTDLIGPYGYCSDVSRAWICGDVAASAAQRTLYAAAHAQVERILELLKPGVGFRELSERGGVLPEPYRAQRYPCVVHGVGLTDEYPAVPYPEDWERVGYDGQLEAGMTLCAESYVGARGGAFGVKLEEQVLVTDSGALRLSDYPFESALL